jgi:hypothetical protein
MNGCKLAQVNLSKTCIENWPDTKFVIVGKMIFLCYTLIGKWREGQVQINVTNVTNYYGVK